MAPPGAAAPVLQTRALACVRGRRTLFKQVELAVGRGSGRGGMAEAEPGRAPPGPICGRPAPGRDVSGGRVATGRGPCAGVGPGAAVAAAVTAGVGDEVALD